MSIPYSAAGLALFFAISPYLVLRGEARRRHAALDAGFWAIALAFTLLAPLFALRVAPSLLLALFVAARTAMLFGIASTAERDCVRWSANGAALFAGAVYLLLVPHVLQWPVDGDEPYYALVAESIAEDGDLDLTNQYRDIASSPVGRPDLAPQFGDPVGPGGERYARHEPLLSLLIVPGFAAAGLPGALATIAIFGALLVRSTMLLLGESGATERARIGLFPFLALGPPAVFYATRLWPEVPAAFLLAEALRAAGRLTAREEERGSGDWIALAVSGLLLSLLKLRFVAIAAVLFALVVLLAPGTPSARAKRAGLLLLAAILPFAILFAVSGSPLNIHQVAELAPKEPLQYLSGLFGLLLDGAGGLLFQAPLYFFALFLVLRWRAMPPVFRIGLASSAAYLLLLFPRAEWYGGWSPPLRYLVVFVPVLALGAARILEAAPGRTPVALLSLWTAGLSIHGIAFPWRLFHLANGENAVGEWLSRIDLNDYSRLFPSFVRVNTAAWVWGGALVAAVVIALLVRPRRVPDPWWSGGAALAIALFFLLGRVPPRTVQFEDAAVGHLGGALMPEQWTVMRYLHRGGWRVSTGDSLVFRYGGGSSRLWYSTHEPALLLINGVRRVRIPQTGGEWRAVRMTLPRGSVEIGVLSGLLVVDRVERE